MVLSELLPRKCKKAVDITMQSQSVVAILKQLQGAQNSIIVDVCGHSEDLGIRQIRMKGRRYRQLESMMWRHRSLAMGWRRIPACALVHLLALLLVALGCLRWGGLADAAITGASVALASTNAGESGAATVVFTTSKSIPVGGTILVVFPSSFLVAPTLLTAPSNVDPSSTISSTGTSVTVTIAGAAVSVGGVSFTLDGMTNPGEPQLDALTLMSIRN